MGVVKFINKAASVAPAGLEETASDVNEEWWIRQPHVDTDRGRGKMKREGYKSNSSQKVQMSDKKKLSESFLETLQIPFNLKNVASFTLSFT